MSQSIHQLILDFLEASHVRDAEKVEACFIHGNQAAFMNGATDEHRPFPKMSKTRWWFLNVSQFLCCLYFHPENCLEK